MTYELNEDSEKHVRAIVKAAKKAEVVYLATDLDREGEAISWHIHEILREQGLTDKIPTERAINDAVENPRELSMDLVNAQQARRALDHLVGFNLSPLLWKKIKTGLSAGRVQSPALRMIVEREREIEAFDPREYWTIEADMGHQDQAFQSRLVRLESERLKQFDIAGTEQAHQIRDRGCSKQRMENCASTGSFANSASGARRPRSSPRHCSRTPRGSCVFPRNGSCARHKTCTKQAIFPI